jgi:hypothetical protein
VIETLKAWGRELNSEPTVIICGGSALLIISHYQGATYSMQSIFGPRFNDHPAFGAITHFYWFAASLLLYLVMPLLISVATRGSSTASTAWGSATGRRASPSPASSSR